MRGGWTLSEPWSKEDNSWISHDVTAPMLVSPNNETAAMMVSRSNTPEIAIERYYYANFFFGFRW